MANDSGRVAILDKLIRDAGVPIDGISVADINANPVQFTIQFQASATQEQIDLAQQIGEAFDWRRRRALARNTVVTALQNLTAGQRAAIQLHQLAEYLRSNPDVAAQVGTFLGTPVSVDEIDPNP